MSFLAPYVLNLICSEGLQNWQRRLGEWRRKKSDKPHTVTVFLRINDPYSYILLQVLERLSQRYNIEFDFRTILQLQEDMYPAPALWEKNAFADSAYLANIYSLDFPRSGPVSTVERNQSATAQLLHAELQGDYLQRALAIFTAYWADNIELLDTLIDPRIARNTECYRHHLLANESLLKSKGHYLTAMLHYGEKPGGEWYWGLSRLEFLEQRLAAIDAIKNHDIATISQAPPVRNDALSGTNTSGTPIIIYWSARSPYSYLGLVRARELSEHYGLDLIVKPVLPMVMRRMQVPQTKGMYIFKDTKREAKKYGIDFGLSADPLGAGVERCYALFDYAVSLGQGNLYLETFARSVWAEGIDAASDSGMKKIVTAAGLDWSIAKPLLQDDKWRDWAQENLLDMYDNGLWGVPSFRYGQLCTFGQDRLDRLEQAIIEERTGHKI
jgi:2-hydroxychromene-2-carboxylate isomerase